MENGGKEYIRLEYVNKGEGQQQIEITERGASEPLNNGAVRRTPGRSRRPESDVRSNTCNSRSNQGVSVSGSSRWNANYGMSRSACCCCVCCRWASRPVLPRDVFVGRPATCFFFFKQKTAYEMIW